MGAEVAADEDIAALFEPGAIVFGTIADGSHVTTLDPSEVRATEAMAPGRVAEFAAGRACARRALIELDGADPGPIGRDERRAPVWPDGVTGSITHTRGYCLAVVARDATQVVGIDAEEIARVHPAIARRVLSEAERDVLARLPDDESQRRLATAFAAKEAFYKAHYQLEARYLGFDAIEVDVLADGRLELRPGAGSVDAATVAAATARYLHAEGRAIVGVGIRR